jgi:hypothetical protein
MFGIDDAIIAGSKLVDDVVTRIWPDATEIEKAKLAQAAQEINNQYALVIGQLDINKVEAASPNWFVAGGRPAAIWVGVLSLLYSGIGVSFLSWIALCFGLPVLPPFTDSTANAILMGLLGLGGMRTAEKLKGVETKNVGK